MVTSGFHIVGVIWDGPMGRKHDMSTGKDILEKKIAKKLKESPDSARDIGAVVAVELTGEGGGRWVLDCTKNPASVKKDGTTPAAATITMSEQHLVDLSAGNLNAVTAFMFGKIKVNGDLSLATKLGKVLS